ncbi:hypothetical protein BH24ACI3_BH24ACI3_03330 [soil metagenome]
MIDDLAYEESCTGRACSYNISRDGGVNCSSGTGGCFAAMMVPAQESVHHDHVLMDATKAINDILMKIPSDPKGRKLSFLATPWGAHLAWVTHGAPVSADAIRHDADEAVLAKALNIDSYSTASAAE